MKLILLGEPKSTNHIYKYHCKFGRPAGYMSAEGKALKESYQWQIKSQWKQKPEIGPLKVNATLYFGTRRKHDIDNYNKILLDSMSGLVLIDDSQIKSLSVKIEYDKENPRIEVEINKI